MLEKIEKQIREQNKNVIDIALYNNGEVNDIEYLSLIRVVPCQNCYSLSKSVISLGIGIAYDMGLLSLDDPIVKFFPDKLPDTPDERLGRVTVKNLLTMTMGNAHGYLFENDRYSYAERDWVKLILFKPLELEPGEKFVYSNTCFYLLSALLHRAAGMPALDFLRANLFDPLGINSYAWEVCPHGEIMGATGLYMSTPDILKIGQMCLWKGVNAARKRIVSEAYLNDATTNRLADVKDAPQYGYGFWINKGGYQGNGAASQIMLVLPERKLVFAAHAYDDGVDYQAMVEKMLEGC